MSTRRNYLKILVSGPYASGKTTFVKTVATSSLLTTEVPVSTLYESQVKQYTTIAFDYGKTNVDGVDVYLFGTPGQTRLQFMWRVLSAGMHGYIFIVDGTSMLHVLRSRAVYEYMKSLGDYPHVVAVSKQDLPNSVKPSIVAQLFGISPGSVMPLVTHDRSSALTVLKRIVEIVRESTDQPFFK
ncbi:ATP/GTP-binding protein [Infirmifilum lucidum]|uniref:ATP/GTP-binding protein n=1 Tax=Infirmifilum lucidum TaxID=2776706 RepID=A0A7L9FF01_9CREN|nr:ATP/GTP-binding protein [Infirmifilum lucidum]QOJ78370.1 ATP/GTP-binding protein [Infirmifilum lucidum]